MNSRERVQITLNHKEPDRVPLDLGGSVISGMHVSSVYLLRQALRLDEPGTPVKVIEPYQMLGEIEPDLIDSLGDDVVSIIPLKDFFGFNNEGWKPWATFDGTPVLVPEAFNTEPEPSGDILQYPEGDKSAPASGHMPKGGWYFDAIIRQPPLDEDDLNIEDNLEEFRPISEEELAYFGRKAKQLYQETDKAIMASFGGTSFGDIALVPATGMKHPKGIRDITEWYISTSVRRDYVYKIFEYQCDIALENLAKIFPESADGPATGPALYRTAVARGREHLSVCRGRGSDSPRIADREPLARLHGDAIMAQTTENVAVVCDPRGPDAPAMKTFLEARGLTRTTWHAPRDLDDVDQDVRAGRLAHVVFVRPDDLLDGIFHGEVALRGECAYAVARLLLHQLVQCLLVADARVDAQGELRVARLARAGLEADDEPRGLEVLGEAHDVRVPAPVERAGEVRIPHAWVEVRRAAGFVDEHGLGVEVAFGAGQAVQFSFVRYQRLGEGFIVSACGSWFWFAQRFRCFDSNYCWAAQFCRFGFFKHWTGRKYRFRFFFALGWFTPPGFFCDG